jgi:cytochrome P450
MRTATRDTEIDGVAVPAGSIVNVNIGSANHDER